MDKTEDSSRKAAANNPYQYKGFVIRRADPSRTWLLRIQTEIDHPYLKGTFTKLAEAMKAIDTYISERDKNNGREERTTNPTHSDGRNQDTEATA